MATLNVSGRTFREEFDDRPVPLGSGLVVRHGLPRRFAPTIPLLFIDRRRLRLGRRREYDQRVEALESAVDDLEARLADVEAYQACMNRILPVRQEFKRPFRLRAAPAGRARALLARAHEQALHVTDVAGWGPRAAPAA